LEIHISDEKEKGLAEIGIFDCEIEGWKFICMLNSLDRK
jgi:hypothetical protein